MDWTFLINYGFSYIPTKIVTCAVFTVRFLFDSTNLVFRVYLSCYILFVLLGYLLRTALLREFSVFYSYFEFFFCYFIVSLFLSFWISFSIFIYNYLHLNRKLYFIGPEIIPPTDIDVNEDNPVPPPTIKPKINVSGNAWNGGNGQRILDRIKLRGKWRFACDVIGVCALVANTNLLYINTKAIWESNYQAADATLVKKKELGLITTNEYFEEKYKLDKAYKKI